MVGKVTRNRDRGKAHQKKVSKQLGGLNIGTLGGADVITDRYAIECKSVSRFIGRKWFQQATKNSGGRIPVVIVHTTGTPYETDLVVIDLKTFKEIGGIKC